MRYNQLQEAIIKVPQEILSKVNMYVASYLYFKIKQYLDRLDLFVSPNMSQEEREQIIKDGKTTMAKLQSQYGAKNISSQTAANINNNNIEIPFDVETFFNELNYKGVNPGLVSLLKNRLKLYLLITPSSQGIAGSKEQTGDYSFLVTVVVGGLKPRPSFLETANDIMSTTYHELQHIVQSIAIKNISSNDKQLQRNPGYSDRESDLSDYYTSGIEFTPQLGNVIDYINLELEKSTLKDELNQDKNSAIKDAIHKVVQTSDESRTFLMHLYRKKPDQYKKAMSALYKYVSPVYDKLKANGIDYAYTELDPEELEVNTNVMLSVYKMMYKKDQYKVQAFGRTLDDIVKLEIKSNSWSIILERNSIRNDQYYIQINSTDPVFEENEKMNSKEVLNLFGILSEITWYDGSDIVDDIEFITGQRKDASQENIKDLIQTLQSDAEALEVPFEITGTDSFNALGHEFRIERVPDSAEKIDINQDNGAKTYYVWSMKQMLIAFQYLIRMYSFDQQAVEGILNNKDQVMYVEVMNSLREI